MMEKLPLKTQVSEEIDLADIGDSMDIDFRFIGQDQSDKEKFEPIVLSRCFDGWEKIKDKYHRPNCDGDIVLFIPKQFGGDIQDAKTIIDFLQGE
ncbi:MAG: hypothetical protein SVO01_07920 [Thermotogota bacterium]|nr:hypothetical protein [Thermotogota bacterium]